MSQISQKTNKSAVKRVFKFLVVFGFLTPLSSFGVTQKDIDDLKAECAPTFAAARDNNASRAVGDDATACRTRLTAMEAALAAQVAKAAELCKNSIDAVKKARTELIKKCAEGGFKLTEDNPSGCVEEATACAEEASKESHSELSDLSNSAIPALGGLMSALKERNNSSSNKGCSKYSRKDYMTEKEKITKDLDSTAKELADLAKEKATAEKEYKKDLLDIQKSVQDAQRKAKEKKLEMSEKARERARNFEKNQDQLKESARQKNMAILNVKGKIITSERDKAMKLVALTDASGKRTCMNEYNKARAAYQKSMSSSSTTNHLASGSSKKQDLVAIFTDCMSVFNQQRTALIESKTQEMKELNETLANLQSEADEIKGQQDLAKNQIAEMVADAETEKNEADLEVAQFMQNAQQQMAAAQTDLDASLKNITEQTNTLTKKNTRLTNELGALGPLPKSGVKSDPDTVAIEAGGHATDLEESESALKDLVDKGVCTKAGTPTGSKSTKGRK